MLKVDFLRAAGFILDIVVDITHLDEDVKSEYLKRKETEQEYIDKHLEVTALKYDKITHITFAMTELDDIIIEEYKNIAKRYNTMKEHPVMKAAKELAKICNKTECECCPFYNFINEDTPCYITGNKKNPAIWFN